MATIRGGGISIIGPVVGGNMTFSVTKRALPKLKLSSELSLVTSQVIGLKISSTHLSSPAPLSVPFNPILYYVARKNGVFSGEQDNNGRRFVDGRILNGEEREKE